jgi:hypothetical protein
MLSYIVTVLAATLACVILGRLWLWATEALRRRAVRGWTLVDVRTSLDVSRPTVAAQKGRALPLATEVWEDPATGARKEIRLYWP